MRTSCRVLALVLGVILGVATPAPGSVEDTLDRILDTKYQTELPRAGQQPASPATDIDERGHRRELRPGAPGQQRPRRVYQRAQSGVLGQIASALLWVLVGVVVLVLVSWLVQEYRGSHDDPAPARPPSDDDTEARAAVVAQPLNDAEALAQQDRFDEAIHALLLRTVEALERTLPTGLPRSLTSREILALVSMNESARVAFSELVRAVELSYFGSQVPGPAEYRACRAYFQRFAEAYVQRAA